MKRNLFLIFIIIFISILLTGCIQEDTSSNTASSNKLASGESNDVKQLNEPESIETILTKSENIDSMYYEISIDMNISSFGKQTAMIKIWQKEPYIKQEITSDAGGYSTSILVIQGPEGTYLYDAEKGKYIISTDDVSSISESLQYFDNDMILNSISNQSSSNLEKEIIDGKQTTFFEYSPTQDDDFIHVKLWIWNEKGVPLKGIIDMSFEEITMNMEFNFSNYSFTDIQDSVFSLT